MGDRELTDEEKRQIKETHELPEWLQKDIDQTLRDGVFFKLDWNPDLSHRTASIHWRPGDRNFLAEKIIEYVTTKEMPLELDGNNYLIRKVE